ncbi:24262_t:CDS:2, partial [Racocetra persica]
NKYPIRRVAINYFSYCLRTKVMHDPFAILKGEINRLSFTSIERIQLFSYFTNNVETITVAMSCLADLTDDDKCGYLRSLISKPGIPEEVLANRIKYLMSKTERILCLLLGLQYMKPEPLLSTSGADWEYHPHPSLKHILRSELKQHYENFCSGCFDKMLLPLYLFLSGIGTRKSRNASEFHQTAISCLSAQEDRELLTKIKEAWVFLVSYENGTSLRDDETSAYRAVGTRMLHQLLRDKMSFDNIIQKYDPPTPLSVVSLVAKYHNRDLKKITVILVVDGMQQLMNNKDDGLKSDSWFYMALSNIADLVFSGTFLIPVCTSAITGLVEGTFKYSNRKRVYLPIASLQPPNYCQGGSLIPVFKNDEITNTLVEDCGGHGRALEVLNECLAGRNIEECNLNALMNDLHHKLTKKYRDAILGSVKDARPLTPDEFAASGLIRLEQIDKDSPVGYLTALYIWLWILVEICNEQGAPIFRDQDYGEQRALLNP